MFNSKGRFFWRLLSEAALPPASLRSRPKKLGRLPKWPNTGHSGSLSNVLGRLLREAGGRAASGRSRQKNWPIVPYVKHEIVAIAPTLDCPIILLKSPTHIPDNFSLIKAQYDGLHLSYHPKNRVENNTRMLVGHEQHDLCDSYIFDVVHDATENYF